MIQNEQNKTNKGANSTLGNLIFNILLPLIVLFKAPKMIEKITDMAAKDAGKTSLIAALSLPLAYFVYHYLKEKKTSLMSIVGFIGILFTGLIGLLDLPREYIAIERAIVPLIFSIAIFISNHTSNSIVKRMFHNPMIFDTSKIDHLISENGTEKDFEKTQKQTSFIIAFTFVFSSICNYFITQHYMADESITFTDAYAKVKTMSFFITVIPLLAMSAAAILFYQKRLVKHTGVKDAEELYSDEIKDNKKQS